MCCNEFINICEIITVTVTVVALFVSVIIELKRQRKETDRFREKQKADSERQREILQWDFYNDYAARFQDIIVHIPEGIL
jgi:hypothetical protein